jgi:NAD+-dependent protein deacetylase sirtuin 2
VPFFVSIQSNPADPPILAMGCAPSDCCGPNPISPYVKYATNKSKCPLQTVNFAGIAELIKSGMCENIVWLSGAGISCSAGIPDFRTPGTGLYSNLQKYNLPEPEAMFDLDFFRSNPEPFYDLARVLYPGYYSPTLTHFFILLLHRKKKLLRTYTQNIDMLERVAGIPSHKIVEAHGTWSQASCIDCWEPEDGNWVRTRIKKKLSCNCRHCGGNLKPNIVFFGEPVSMDLERQALADLRKADLLIVAGTSLQVQPFCKLIEMVEPYVPRVLFNLDPVGVRGEFIGDGGFLFGHPKNYRDVCVLGEVDLIVTKFAKMLGWVKDLQRLVKDHKAPEMGRLFSP